MSTATSISPTSWHKVLEVYMYAQFCHAKTLLTLPLFACMPAAHMCVHAEVAQNARDANRLLRELGGGGTEAAGGVGADSLLRFETQTVRVAAGDCTCMAAGYLHGC